MNDQTTHAQRVREFFPAALCVTREWRPGASDYYAITIPGDAPGHCHRLGQGSTRAAAWADAWIGLDKAGMAHICHDASKPAPSTPKEGQP